MKYTTWLKAASFVSILTACVHSLGLFSRLTSENPKEQEVFDMMWNVQLDMGAGIFHSAGDLFTALSSCFALLFLLSGVLNLYLLRRGIGPDVLKGVITIHLVVLGTCFVVMAMLTFLPPIILTGLVTALLIGARVSIGRVVS